CAAGLFRALASHRSHTSLPTYQVHFETVQPTISVRGDVESAEVTDIICRVRSWSSPTSPATIIKWVIDNGAIVERGQVLVELDDSGLREQLQERKVFLEQARAALAFAEENEKIVASQNESDIQAARVAVELAELDLKKYMNGDYPQAYQDVQ